MKKYFPKYIYIDGNRGIRKKIGTGNHIYRIGGDEFAMIIDSEPLDIIEQKIEQLREEVEMIDLGVVGELPIGINYGIAIREANEPIFFLYSKADESLRRDKTLMYRNLRIDRRR